MLSVENVSIGLVELPEFGLLTSEGNDWLIHKYKESVLISKQILLANLQGAGFKVELINLNNGNYQEDYGKFEWGGIAFTKVYTGQSLASINPSKHDVWGITNNFSQSREIACLTIKHFASQGRPVIVGGSDAIASPLEYISAGATAVILDKSGAANVDVIGYILGHVPKEHLSGVILATGDQPPPRPRKPLHPEDWALPSVETAKLCLGKDFKGLPLPEENWPIGSIFTDIGCDRTCDFCQTPKYHVGYRAMSPERVGQWAEIQKQAGAKAVMLSSDQFLGRILKKGGRDDIMEIMQILRDLELAVFWNNGIELKKMTLGRGINRKNADLTPDDELIASLMGWDGNKGCYYAYLPAERPIFGQENYKKLLPWQEHRDIMKAIVRTGVAYIRYGIIIGFADDSHDTLSRLEESIWGLYEELALVNPDVKFQVAAFSLSPIPGTAQSEYVRKSGLLRFNDPSIFGGLWTTSVESKHLSYLEIFDWQKRLTKIGRSCYIDAGFETASI